MYYGWRGMTLLADSILRRLACRARITAFSMSLRDQPDISIGALIEVLGISKQALNRPPQPVAAA